MLCTHTLRIPFEWWLTLQLRVETHYELHIITHLAAKKQQFSAASYNAGCQSCCLNQIRLITRFKFVIVSADRSPKQSQSQSNRHESHHILDFRLLTVLCSTFIAWFLVISMIVRLDSIIYIFGVAGIYFPCHAVEEKKVETLLKVVIDRSGLV